MSADAVRSTCPYCGVGCGVLLSAVPDGLAVRGDRDHPASYGRLCSKGSALGETVGLNHRLLAPRVNGRETAWDEALQSVADRFRETHCDARPRQRGFLRFRPVADRGLLRRQQADEGFRRLGQYRHQLAALHGLVGGRAQAGLRHRHRAGHLRGHRRGGPRGAGRLEPRVVSPGAAPAAHGGAQGARHPDRGRSTRAAPPVATAPTCTSRSAPGSDVALFNHLLAQIHEQGALDEAFIAHTERLRCGARRRAQ